MRDKREPLKEQQGFPKKDSSDTAPHHFSQKVFDVIEK